MAQIPVALKPLTAPIWQGRRSAELNLALRQPSVFGYDLARKLVWSRNLGAYRTLN